MARAAIADPIKVFRFRIYIPDLGAEAGFSEFTGMESETEVAEYREGGFNDTVQKSPGLTKFADVTLKRGQLVATGLGADLMWQWMSTVYDAARGIGTLDMFRRDITVQQYASTNAEARKWILRECWPKKFKPFTDMNGTSSDNSIEELVLAHEGFERLA